MKKVKPQSECSMPVSNNVTLTLSHVCHYVLSVIRQFRVWLNSPATLTWGQPIWIGHFPRALRGKTKKTAPLNGTFYVPPASHMNIWGKMRGENRDTRCTQDSWAERCLRAHVLSLSPTPTCSPPHLSSTPAIQNFYTQMNHLSIQYFPRRSLWIQPFSWTDMEVRGQIWSVFEQGIKTESTTAWSDIHFEEKCYSRLKAGLLFLLWQLLQVHLCISFSALYAFLCLSHFVQKLHTNWTEIKPKHLWNFWAVEWKWSQTR